MPIFLYIFVFFVLFVVIAFFWFYSSSQQYRNNFSNFPNNTPFERELGFSEILFKDVVRTIEVAVERAKWLLFFAIFLLLIEFFVFIAFFIENVGAPITLQGQQHLFFIAGIVYFFVLLFTVFICLRSLSIGKEIPTGTGQNSWQNASFDSGLQNLNEEQKKNLAQFLVSKKRLVEQGYRVGLAMLAVAITLLMIFVVRWLYLTFN